MAPRALRTGTRLARRVAIGVAGGAILVAGIVMIVLPGPAIVAIPTGLAVLALEFAWAARWRDALLRRLGREPGGEESASGARAS
jgi:tellurite resistance protein TerC